MLFLRNSQKLVREIFKGKHGLSPEIMKGVFDIIETSYFLWNKTQYNSKKNEPENMTLKLCAIFVLNFKPKFYMIVKTLTSFKEFKTKISGTKKLCSYTVQNTFSPSKVSFDNHRSDNSGFPTCFEHHCKEASTEDRFGDKCSALLKDRCTCQTYCPCL